MASKLLHSLTDHENTDLQRQIGCMTGIFQIFDRHHVLTGSRHINPKKYESNKVKKISNNNAAAAAAAEAETNERKQRIVSMESSQTSFSSSSRSSSFSSIDCSRTTTAQPETAFSFERVIFPDTPSRITPMSQSTASPHFLSHQSLDLRDVVKDSMLYREVELSDWSSLNQNGDVPRKSCNSTTTTNIFAFPKDYPRFSYDLGENFKSTAPRLSLDSREGSLRSLKDSKPRLLRNSKSQREGSNCSTDLVSNLQQSSPIQNRLPSVVAKLMGLEALPANQQSMPSMKTSVVVVVEETKSSSSSSSKQPAQGNSSRKEPNSPRRRNNDVVVMKPITISRFPIEPAPWKQIHGGKRIQRSKTTTIRTADTFPSVYGEIEKRMKDLEFTQAGKDLRALKQILDAMQTKGLLETEIEDDRKPVLKSKQVVINRSNSDSPIVIMKPAKLVEKSGIPTTKDHIQKTSRTNVRTPKPPQSSSRRSPKEEEKPKTSSPSISPRMHQKKLELQKKSRPPNPPSDSNKSRRQTNNSMQQPMPETNTNSSPGGKRRPKPLAKLKKEENSNHSSDGYVVVSDSGTETEVTSSFRPAEKLDLEELVQITAEQQQPSPVSVLDNSLYNDNDNEVDTTCVKTGIKADTINRKKLENIELLVEKLKQLNSGHNESQTDYIASLCEDTNPDHRYISEILLASGLILRDLNNSTSEESFRFHPSGYPINPELYLVLEQTKAGKSNSLHKEEKGNEKVHRKLVFDSVNEILSVKLLLSSSSSPYSEKWSRPIKRAKSCLNGQKLLKELCFEIDKQHKQIEEDDSLESIVWEDVIDGKGSWMDFSSEISEAVLDVERMLFKDLVDEIVRGEGFRRQPFLH